ncbi:uncharacterized histidine-rich protein DDB_G0274557 [Condylostylus longicornis]|uniref:uncharacterized histidine-rich protein DDB_G0274557 n=1 Tax=Condylostylus longicornis TaxID=2530218 RepID=UPI00244E2AAB|nr:uncharacterized histidine-rich protein DDB_G0274557 [Condylostylus longicornis]
MTASINDRKRSREEDGNNEDHMPLSKRINMLHINNTYNIDSNQQHNGHHNGLIMPLNQPAVYMNGNTHINGHSVHNGNNQQHHHQPSHSHHHHHHHHHENGHLVHIASSHIEIEDNSTYNPELNQDENPYYYNKNKLLFELHLERSKRNINEKI